MVFKSSHWSLCREQTREIKKAKGKRIQSEGYCNNPGQQIIVTGTRLYKKKVYKTFSVHTFVNCKLVLACQLEIATGQEHLPVTEQNSSKSICHCVCRDWTPAGMSVDLQHPLREFMVEWSPLLQRIWWNRSLDRYFQELISWSQSLHLFISRKSLYPFMVTSAEHD